MNNEGGNEEVESNNVDNLLDIQPSDPVAEEEVDFELT